MQNGIYINIPVTCQLDPEQTEKILEQHAVEEMAERFLENENFRCKANVKLTKAFFKQTFTKPQISTKHIRDNEYEMQIQFRENEIQKAQNQKVLALERQQNAFDSLVRKAHIQQQVSLMQQAYQFAQPDLQALPKVQLKEDKLKFKQVPMEHVPIIPECLMNSVYLQDTNYDTNYEESHSDEYYENIYRRQQLQQKQIEQQQHMQTSVLDPKGVPLHFVQIQDFVIMQELQKLLEDNNDHSGPLWCIGGLSFYEIVKRFIMQQAPQLKQDQPPQVGKTNYPFNPCRRDIQIVAKESVKRKIEIINKLMDKHLFYRFPIILEEVFPEPLFQLLYVMGINEKYKVQDYFKVQVLIAPENENIKLIVDEMQRDLQLQLDKEFSKQVADIVTNIVVNRFVDGSTQASRFVIDFYHKNIQPHPPTILNDPDCKQVVSCHMDERQCSDILDVDVVRYLEGFIASLDFYKLFCNYNIGTDQISLISQKCISNEAVAFAKTLALIFKTSYIEPLNITCTLNKDNIIANSVQTNVSLKDQTLSQLRATGKAMTYSQISQTKYKYFWLFQSELEKQQNLIMQDESVKQLIRIMNNAYNDLFYIDKVADIATNAGSEALVQYVNTNLAETQKSISPLRFRKIRAQFMDIMNPNRKLENETEKQRTQREGINKFIEEFQEQIPQNKKLDFDAIVSQKLSGQNRSLSPIKMLKEFQGKQFVRQHPKPVLPSHTPFSQKLSIDNPFQMTDYTPESQQSHLRLHMPVLLLACKVAAVKVVEEEYPFLIHSHVGRVLEYKCFSSIFKDLPGSSIFEKSIVDFLAPEMK